MTEAPLLEMNDICKSFPGVRALHNVSLSVRRGEILGLVGENGAGKSTLMQILAGIYPDHGGRMTLDGRPLRLRTPRQAMDQGIGVVYQEFNLCPNLSAQENLFLGNETANRAGIISRSSMRARCADTFSRLNLKVDPSTPVRKLGVAQQQMIEIAKALIHETRVLVMDEPTAVLTERETERLFSIMTELAGRGISIIFVSHKLKEVLRITGRVVCLRDGENSGEIETARATESDLVSMMVGRELDRMYSARANKPFDEVALEVRGLSGPPGVRDVSFSIRRGEILGMAGLVGAGRTEVARLLIGAERKTSGVVTKQGRILNIRHPADAVANGISYVSEDRKQLGLVLPMTVRENTTMSIHRRILNRFRLISAAKERDVTDRYIDRLQMRVSGREQVTRNLSGGNQQKVALAKSLAADPDVLILDEPTRGIDVGTKAEVHRIISGLADDGVAIIVISSELPEILHLSDRILVMHEGRLTAIIPREEADEETVMKAAVA